MSLDTNKLIPELQRWNDGRGIDLEGYLSCMGNYELAIAFGHFFWPTFVEHDGCLFRGHPNVEIYEQWKAQMGDDKSAIEGMMNHVHILDLFPNVEKPPTRDHIVYIGRQLRDMWSAKVRNDFPHLDVVVEFFDGGEDLLEYQITLFQNRPSSHSPP